MALAQQLASREHLRIKYTLVYVCTIWGTYACSTLPSLNKMKTYSPVCYFVLLILLFLFLVVFLLYVHRRQQGEVE